MWTGDGTKRNLAIRLHIIRWTSWIIEAPAMTGETGFHSLFFSVARRISKWSIIYYMYEMSPIQICMKWVLILKWGAYCIYTLYTFVWNNLLNQNVHLLIQTCSDLQWACVCVHLYCAWRKATKKTCFDFRRANTKRFPHRKMYRNRSKSGRSKPIYCNQLEWQRTKDVQEAAYEGLPRRADEKILGTIERLWNSPCSDSQCQQ